VSGHKIHAPKGSAALYVRKHARILPLAFGGGHEHGLRPGTESVPLICAFGQAAENAAKNLSENLDKASRLRDHFINRTADLSGLCINSPADASPYICDISILGYRSEIMLHYLASKGVYVSSGSACSGGEKSHVLQAMNLSPARVDSALRVSFSKHNTTEDVDAFFDALARGTKEIAR
jgi:cysteine desulfurase